MSLFQWVRYTAVFLDKNNKVCDSKIFGRSFGFKGLKEGTFEHNGGLYNIKSDAFKIQTSLKTHIFFDDDIYLYYYGNPDPLKFENNSFVPFMDSEVYKSRLKNKLIVDLNSIAMGSFDWTTFLKWAGLGLVVFLVVLYFLKRGDSQTSAEVVQNTTNIIRSSRGV